MPSGDKVQILAPSSMAAQAGSNPFAALNKFERATQRTVTVRGCVGCLRRRSLMLAVPLTLP